MEPFTIFMIGKLGAMALRELSKQLPSGSSSAPAKKETEEEKLQRKYRELLYRYENIDWPQHVDPRLYSESHYQALLEKLLPQEKYHREFKKLLWMIQYIDPNYFRQPDMPMSPTIITTHRRQYQYSKKWFDVFAAENKRLFDWNRIDLPSFPYTQETVTSTTQALKQRRDSQNTMMAILVFTVLSAIIALALFS